VRLVGGRGAGVWFVRTQRTPLDPPLLLAKQQNLSSTCPHNMANFSPLTAEISWRVWGTPSKFQRVLRLGFVTTATSFTGGQPNFARCLLVSYGLVHNNTAYTFSGLLLPDGILPCANFTLRRLRPNMAFSYIGLLAALLHGTRRP